MKWMIPALALLLACGCLNRGKAKLGQLEVTPPANAEGASTLSNGVIRDSVTIPAGSTVKVIETPANGQEMAKRETQYVFAGDSVQSRTEEVARVEVAAVRAPDKSVEIHRANIEERRPLLYVSMAAALAAIVCMVLKWPSVAALCGVASVVFFIAWKVSGLPGWFWGVGVVCLVGGGAMMLGYKRAEWDADGDGTPDILQKRTVTTTETKTEVKP